jgi:hypothetical protein
MIIKSKKYVIATKSNPLQFDANEDISNYSEGEFTDYIEDAYLYSEEEIAQIEIKACFDDPDLYKVMPVTLTYEF